MQFEYNVFSFVLAYSDLQFEVCLKIDKNNKRASDLQQMLNSWKDQALKYHNGEITKDEYDEWRYTYPQYNNTRIHSKLYSQKFSDSLVDALRNKIPK